MKKLFYSLFALAMTAMTFTSCEDVPMPYNLPTSNGGGEEATNEPAGSGTVADPFNVAAAHDFIDNDEGLENSVYVKGIVVSVREVDTSSYGNATYYISDDGTTTNQLEVYRGYSLNGRKFTAEDEIKVGDEVVVFGVLVNYNGTHEFTQGSSIYSINGEGGIGGATGEPSGSGTLNDPYNAAGVINYINTLGADTESAQEVYIKGKVVSITEQYGTQYGNATFNIADEGAEGTQFTVFRALYLGNKKYTEGDLLKEGDEVIICGKVVNYRGNTPETVQGSAYLYSLNGKSEDGGNNTPVTGEAKGSGTAADPYNAVAALKVIEGLGADVQSDEVYIKGKIVTVTISTQYGNADYYISDDGTATNQLQVYRGYGLDGAKFTTGTEIKAGDEVVIKGKLVNFRGNTPEVATGSSIVSINGGGNVTPEPANAGTYNAPLTVTEAIALGNVTIDGAWVKGYIVGYVDGQYYENGARFEAGGSTNILIAASANETNVTNCMPVQLPRGEFRTGLNLTSNPDLLGKEIIMSGQLAAYFNVPGIKSPTYAEVNGTTFGSK